MSVEDRTALLAVLEDVDILVDNAGFYRFLPTAATVPGLPAAPTPHPMDHDNSAAHPHRGRRTQRSATSTRPDSSGRAPQNSPACDTQAGRRR